MNPYIIIGFLVALIFVGITGYRIGEHVTEAEWQAKTIKAQEQAAADSVAVAKVISDTAARWAATYAAQQSKLQVAENTWHVIYRTIKEKVPVYVTQAADARCVVPNGFVVLYDSAFGGTVPEPAASAAGGGPVDMDGPSGVPLSQVANVSADNADACHGWEAKTQSCRVALKATTDFYNDLKGSVHVCK